MRAHSSLQRLLEGGVATWSPISRPVYLPESLFLRRQPAGSCLERPWWAQMPSLFFTQLLQGPQKGTGDREEQRERPCPSFAPCYLLLLLPTRQMGVSSHHPDRLQATKIPLASSSMTANQVSGASPVARALPSLWPLLVSPVFCLLLKEGLSQPFGDRERFYLGQRNRSLHLFSQPCWPESERESSLVAECHSQGRVLAKCLRFCMKVPGDSPPLPGLQLYETRARNPHPDHSI